jgi:hypothetical protein
MNLVTARVKPVDTAKLMSAMTAYASIILLS